MIAALVVAVAVLAAALAVALLTLWRTNLVLRELERIVADADDRVRVLELKLLTARRTP